MLEQHPLAHLRLALIAFDEGRGDALVVHHCDQFQAAMDTAARRETVAGREAGSRSPRPAGVRLSREVVASAVATAGELGCWVREGPAAWTRLLSSRRRFALALLAPDALG